MSNRKTRRESPAVNAGSMADIAFLLLIFFLVTTTIAEDKGVLVNLPQWTNEPLPPTAVNDDNVLTVIVNSADELLVEDNEARVADLPTLLRDHVISPKRTPKQAVISLVHDRGTSYERYLQIYDALKLGYKNVWDDDALRAYGKTYDLLTPVQQREVRTRVPMVISEAEPSDNQITKS